MNDEFVRDPNDQRMIDQRSKEQTAARFSNRPVPKLLYLDEYERRERLNCPICGWSGLAEDAGGEAFDALFDVCCPECDQMLLIVDYRRSTDPVPAIDDGMGPPLTALEYDDLMALDPAAHIRGPDETGTVEQQVNVAVMGHLIGCELFNGYLPAEDAVRAAIMRLLRARKVIE